MHRECAPLIAQPGAGFQGPNPVVNKVAHPPPPPPPRATALPGRDVVCAAAGVDLRQGTVPGGRVGTAAWAGQTVSTA